MNNLVEVPFEGGTILVASTSDHGGQAMSSKGGVIQKAEKSLEEVMGTVKTMGQAMSESLKQLEFAAAEATFGISFNAKGQFIVAEASAQASLNIKLTFNK